MTKEKLMILGEKSFDMANYVEYRHDSVAIWNDLTFESCKIVINDGKLNMTIPNQGGFSLEQLNVAITCLASYFGEARRSRIGEADTGLLQQIQDIE